VLTPICYSGSLPDPEPDGKANLAAISEFPRSLGLITFAYTQAHEASIVLAPVGRSVGRGIRQAGLVVSPLSNSPTAQVLLGS